MPAASRPGFCGATAAVRKAAPVHPTMVVPISIDATAALAKALRFMALPIPGRRRARQFAGQPVHLRQAGKIGVQRLCHHLLRGSRSEEHTSELQSLMRISYAVFCFKKKKDRTNNDKHSNTK